MGPPASGKGTQGRRLAQSLGLPYLSTGALLREQVENDTPLGKQAAPILARGGYLPDELMGPILADWLERHVGDGWVLDGFPRSVRQAEFLDTWLGGHGLKLDAAISLEVPIENLLGRIKNRVECPDCRWTGQRAQLKDGDRCPECGAPAGSRSDDDEENFRSRYAEFQRHTLPVIRRYREQGVLFVCDATAAPDEVARTIVSRFVESTPPAV